MNNILDEAMYDTRQTASLVRTTANTLKQSRCTGELRKGIPTIPFVKQGRSIGYRGKDIRTWLAKHAGPTFASTADYRKHMQQTPTGDVV